MLHQLIKNKRISQWKTWQKMLQQVHMLTTPKSRNSLTAYPHKQTHLPTHCNQKL
jgi:hypothetical protein